MNLSSNSKWLEIRNSLGGKAIAKGQIRGQQKDKTKSLMGSFKLFFYLKISGALKQNHVFGIGIRLPRIYSKNSSYISAL